MRDPALVLADDKRATIVSAIVEDRLVASATGVSEAALADEICVRLGLSEREATQVVVWLLRQLDRVGTVTSVKAAQTRYVLTREGRSEVSLLRSLRFETDYASRPDRGISEGDQPPKPGAGKLDHLIEQFGTSGAVTRGTGRDSRPGSAVRPIMYATNRAIERDGTATSNGATVGNLVFGQADVSVPRDHKMGRLESPSITRLEFREDPERHVVVQRSQPQSRERFEKQLRTDPDHGPLVFVHGYNVGHVDALKRAAQLAYDLAYEGPVIAYSWPSHGQLLKYSWDEEQVEVSQPSFDDFIALLLEPPVSARVRLIAHSMGNRLITRNVERRAVMPGAHETRLENVIFAAADVNRVVFEQRVANIGRTAAKATLYASDRDRALLGSKKFNGAPRAGDASPTPLICPGMDSVDVSLVDTDLSGHGYFAANDTVISDLFYALRGIAPSERVRLRRLQIENSAFWRFAP